MPSFKVEMWEQVTVWQRVKVVISADSEEALHEKIKSNSFVLDDCYDADPDWNTEAHLEYDTSSYELLANWEDSNA
jgi:hypothetical protein